MRELILTLDAMLIIVGNISDGLVVCDKIIEKAIKAELPFMVTEKILMKPADLCGIAPEQVEERGKTFAFSPFINLKK